MAKTHEFVLPSGVKCITRGLIGRDQEILTDQSAKSGENLYKMLEGCILQLGDKTDINTNDVKRMLVADSKYCLIRIRHYSLGFQPEFKFTYSWATDGGDKVSEPYNFNVNKHNFKVKPYKWVQELMEGEVIEGNEFYDEYPELYTSYSDMLDKNLIQVFEVEDSEPIEWKIATNEAEIKWSTAGRQYQNANLPLRMREPKVRMETKGSESCNR
jgi:hypothetical protein